MNFAHGCSQGFHKSFQGPGGKFEGQSVMHPCGCVKASNRFCMALLDRSCKKIAAASSRCPLPSCGLRSWLPFFFAPCITYINSAALSNLVILLPRTLLCLISGSAGPQNEGHWTHGGCLPKTKNRSCKARQARQGHARSIHNHEVCLHMSFIPHGVARLLMQNVFPPSPPPSSSS